MYGFSEFDHPKSISSPKRPIFIPFFLQLNVLLSSKKRDKKERGKRATIQEETADTLSDTKQRCLWFKHLLTHVKYSNSLSEDRLNIVYCVCAPYVFFEFREKLLDYACLPMELIQVISKFPFYSNIHVLFFCRLSCFLRAVDDGKTNKQQEDTYSTQEEYPYNSSEQLL